ncbi:5-oxoprolinase subunit PxpB [Pollutibacter soli]|uniref:5-oxoprolinase subunit PxpB n=1 Tax=Pollutibacter soli TaxID=3034157 RepID=UPI00301380CA
MKFPEIRSVSEDVITIRFGDKIDPRVNDQVIAFHQFLQQKKFTGYLESVPSYHTLAVYYSPYAIARISPYRQNTIAEIVKAEIKALLDECGENTRLREKETVIPVCYDPGFAPDLEFVARHCGISTSEVVKLHSAAIYRVYFIGFIPGFPYLGINPDLLQVPRKKVPDFSVPAGSVALAGMQSGIYPYQTPGGWQIIGRTPLHMFDKNSETRSLLTPGQTVRFRAISLSEFNKISGE